MTYVEYKMLNPFQKFAYKLKKFILAIPHALATFFKAIGRFFAKLFLGIGRGFKNYGVTFVKGDWATKLSYIYLVSVTFQRVNIIRNNLFVGRGILHSLHDFLWLDLSQQIRYSRYSRDTQGIRRHNTETVYGDNSMLILLYSVLSIVITVIVFAIYIYNIKDAYKHQQMKAEGKKPTSFIADVKDFLDGKYHITLLSLPTLLIGIFNILPLIFMILIAFTNYDKSHLPPGTLFTWIGLDNFSDLLNVVDGARKATTFMELTKWTLLWAVVATFSNYILGMIFALMINKKGIKFKAFWRTLFVITIAVPQFVSLLLMNQMLQQNGAINVLLGMFLGENPNIQFLNSTTLMARMTVIIVNCWVGIPYTILSMSGILMNIPEDLYESARIDGAGPVKTFTKITLRI